MKLFLRDRAGAAPRDVAPCPETGIGRQPTFRLISPGGITASDAEVAGNPRSRSARLRIAERTDAELEEAA